MLEEAIEKYIKRFESAHTHKLVKRSHSFVIMEYVGVGNPRLVGKQSIACFVALSELKPAFLKARGEQVHKWMEEAPERTSSFHLPKTEDHYQYKSILRAFDITVIATY